MILNSVDSLGIQDEITHTPLQTLLEYICTATGLFSQEVTHLQAVPELNMICKYINTSLSLRMHIDLWGFLHNGYISMLLLKSLFPYLHEPLNFLPLTKK